MTIGAHADATEIYVVAGKLLSKNGIFGTQDSIDWSASLPKVDGYAMVVVECE